MRIEEREQLSTKGFIEDTVTAAIENLARIINAGFETTATKADLAILSERVDNLERSVAAIHDQFSAVYGDIRKLRNDMENADTRSDVVDLQVRVSDLEEKAGTKKRKHLMW